MNFLKKKLYVLFFLVSLIILPIFTFADTVQPINDNTLIINPLGKDGPQNITDFIRIILIGVIKIGLPVIALAIIYCGFLFVKAQGKPDELKKAKDALLYTVIGAALLLGAWAIAQLISNTITQIKY